MFLRKIDWLVVWKIYHYPFFFWSYAALSLATRALMLRRVDPASPFKTWLLSSSASRLVVPAMPFLAVPAFMLVALVAGRVGVYSFFMAVPIAVSLGSAGALVDAILFRLLLRKTVGQKAMWLLFGTNTLVIALAIGGVMALMLVHPHKSLPQ